MEPELRIYSSSITDRGLSEKRPQNEDSFLEMNQCGIFAVADGVGGAQAGDVASQMAVEILGEAFANRSAGSDAEDVMKAAIERANGAIHQMANELPQLASMATTMVALHLENNVATIGHVGDSRLYRVDRDGVLYQETDDHSMVADEVRAGRMTEEQAENHPGRNIISRALGAEPTVDVDLKTIMVDEGTAFLLCSDGITRHITGNEIKGVLTFGGEPNEICDYLKRVCYERGAEDNLTAVVVKIRGAKEQVHPTESPENDDQEEVTLATPRSPFEEVLDESDQEEVLELDTRELVMPAATQRMEREDVLDPFERRVDDEATREPATAVPAAPPSNQAEEPYAFESLSTLGTHELTKPKGSLGKMAEILGLIILGAIIGSAAYHFLAGPQARTNLPISTMTTNNIPLSAFEENRRNVDNDPALWITRNSGSAQDCEDYYLLARAYILSGDYLRARTALIQARDRLPNADPTNAKVIANEIAMGLAVTNDTTIQTNLKKELTDAAAVAAGGANTAR